MYKIYIPYPGKILAMSRGMKQSRINKFLGVTVSGSGFRVWSVRFALDEQTVLSLVDAVPQVFSCSGTEPAHRYAHDQIEHLTAEVSM